MSQCLYSNASLRALSKINLAKQRPHGINSCCSSGGIWFQKWQNLHLTFIIRVLVLSIAPALIKTKGASEVAKNGVSLFSSKSRLHTFFGVGKCTVSPSRACRKSAQAIILGCQRPLLLAKQMNQWPGYKRSYK